MQADLPPSEIYTDGEKIPKHRLSEIYQVPPFVPRDFRRSGVVVGPKGSGKTTLFRYQKEACGTLAAYVSLITAMGSLPRQSGLGPLAVAYPKELEVPLMNKAVALLSLAIAQEVATAGISVPIYALIHCVPNAYRRSLADNVAAITATRYDVAEADFDQFVRGAFIDALREFVAATAERSVAARGGFLLLIDGVDRVPVPAILPVYTLLDQIGAYTLLIATRPGHGNRILAQSLGGLIPGDHYAIYPLGLDPRSTEWRSFARAALQVQMPWLNNVPSDLVEHVLDLSRDSLRAALTILSSTQFDRDDASMRRDIELGLQDARESQLMATDLVLGPYHRNFRRLLEDVRTASNVRGDGAHGPVEIDIQQTKNRSLFDRDAELSAFIENALRSSGLSLRAGEYWTPGRVPHRLEVPPLLVWRKGDAAWQGNQPASLTPHVVTFTDSSIFSVGGGVPAKAKTLFIAYRMNFPSSVELVKTLREHLQDHPTLGVWNIETGRTLPGERWAKQVRERIRRAHIVVGDVTTLRGDVMFELGFAAGLNKHIIPVAEQAGESSMMPRWVTETQLGFFDSITGIMGIVSSIEAVAVGRDARRVTRMPFGVPSRVTWLGHQEWCHEWRDKCRQICSEAGLGFEVVTSDAENSEQLYNALSANVLLAPVDGTRGDALVHFVAGAILARPFSGASTKTIAKKVVVLPRLDSTQMIADSLRRFTPNVDVVKFHELERILMAFAASYRDWAAARNVDAPLGDEP